MSHHQHDQEYIKHLYEGDQSKLYSGVMNHYSDVKSAESKSQVARIWKVTLILSIITIAEVIAGLYAHGMGVPKGIINAGFLIMTVIKAAYIVSIFMHLGEEVKWFRFCVLIPLSLFVWFIIGFIYDGNAWLKINHSNQTRPDASIHQTVK
jgi:heme/copper-type cytochrome/quinol oxidase subunit 4